MSVRELEEMVRDYAMWLACDNSFIASHHMGTSPSDLYRWIHLKYNVPHPAQLREQIAAELQKINTPERYREFAEGEEGYA